MKISIVIPNYNKGGFVRRSLDSVLAQSYQDWEAIVVDDASTDGACEILREYADRDSRVKVLVNATNRGGCYSRNRGASEACGEYLMFLDSDDTLAPDCLERRIAEFEDFPNRQYDLLVFPMGTVRDGRQTGIWRCRDSRKALLGFLRHSIPWSIMMPIWRREAFDRIGGFDKEFPRLQDVELHARALLRGLEYGLARRETPDCFYYIDEDRMTMDHEVLCRKFVAAVKLFAEKMMSIIDDIFRAGGGAFRRSFAVWIWNGRWQKPFWPLCVSLAMQHKLGRFRSPRGMTFLNKSCARNKFLPCIGFTQHVIALGSIV